MEALANILFDNVIPKHDHLGFFRQDETDRERFIKVKDFLNLTNAEIARIAEVSSSSVRFDEKIPEKVAERLQEIAIICELVAGYFEGNIDKTAMWFKAPNPLLGNITPRDMTRAGKFKKVEAVVRQAIQGISP